MPRLIDADSIKSAKYHDLPYTHIHPVGVDVQAYEMGWNDALDAVADSAPTVDVESLITKHEDIGYEKGCRDGYAEALEVADDAERHGHWIESHEVFDYIKCSECGEDWCTEDNDTETFNYCPNCGAKMDEVRDE